MYVLDLNNKEMNLYIYDFVRSNTNREHVEIDFDKFSKKSLVAKEEQN